MDERGMEEKIICVDAACQYDLPIVVIDTKQEGNKQETNQEYKEL
jgi:hypothetical protein